MRRLSLLTIPLMLVGCAQMPAGTSSAPYDQASRPVSEPQPSPQVRTAQEQLRAVGLYAGSVDGLYGQETRVAVERFQRSSGIAATGKLDERTVAALRDEAARSRDPVAMSNPTHVRTVQNRLRQLAYYRGAADGVWGPETQVALEQFQRARGLPVGHVTRPTLIAMELDPGAFVTRTAAGGEAREPLDPVVVRGVQQRLRAFGFYKGSVDGRWGPRTQAALEGFQRSRGLEAGQLNPATASALGLDPNNLAGSAAAIAAESRR